MATRKRCSEYRKTFRPTSRRRSPQRWLILDEPELHFPDPSAPGEHDALVPDLAGAAALLKALLD